MSKIDQVTGMNEADDFPGYSPLNLSPLDAQLLKTQMDNMRTKMHEHLEKSAEILKALRELHQVVNGASSVVRESIKSVKAFPDDVAKRLEACAAKCEIAAQRAQACYEKACIESGKEHYALWKIALTASLSSMGTATFLMLILK